MKKILILPYFGKFPNYFPLYLVSCGWNKNFEWLIITDDHTRYDYPENVRVVYRTFEGLQGLIQDKFDFRISLEHPQKLCDYRPAFGYIFQDYIQGYDFWGHCDPDCIWGNLDEYITSEMLVKYDKLFTHGHLTLYRNTSENNLRFTLPCRGENEYYKKVFSHPGGFIFDEQYIKGINNIFEDNHFPMSIQNVVADADPYHTNFRLAIYNYENKSYMLEKSRRQVFIWDRGVVKRLYMSGRNIAEQNFAYIHLQKRRMMMFESEGRTSFLITPKAFRPFPTGMPERDVLGYYHRYLVNSQYFKVKYGFLKVRLRKLIN